MKEVEITKFLVSFTGQIEHVVFPAGVFDELLYIQYETVWGPDWSPVSGLASGSSQMARSGSNPERVVFNMPLEMVFSSTNVSGWPQIVITVRAQNTVGGDTLRGYALVPLPATAGARTCEAPLLRPLAATMLGEWLAWLTGRHPELAEPRMLASGKENYRLWGPSAHKFSAEIAKRLGHVTGDRRAGGFLAQRISIAIQRGNAASILVLRTESYGTIMVRLSLVSKDFRRLGYDNQPSCHETYNS